MEKNEVNKEKIEEYIRNLIVLNDQINNLDEDSVEDDTEFMTELNKILTALGDDIKEGVITTETKIPSLNVKIKKIHPDAVIPSYSNDGDAGMDLTITHIIHENPVSITYGFGISMEIPFGYVGLVFPRSSIRNLDLILSNCVGVIDSAYRGEIQSTFKKHTPTRMTKKYNIGDRGAQIIILPYPRIQFIEVDNLSDTKRGFGGFGSTGT